MKVCIFDTHKFDISALNAANHQRHDLSFHEVRLNSKTAILARGSDVAVCFANDQADRAALTILKEVGVKLIALRSAGYNHVDLKAASELKLTVVRVPYYSPYSVAEHAVGLLLTLNRKIHRAFNRVRDLNFSLDGFLGFDLHGKTAAVIGTGRIGKAFCQIMRGFGCRVIAYDQAPDLQWAEQNGVSYVGLDVLFLESDIISLHVPLSPKTHHLINATNLACMKKNIFLINTGRGALIDTHALIQALKNHSIGGACLDVYEEEEGVFFSDLSENGINDDILARLLTFPNVLMTSHQAFLTQEALTTIAETTISSISKFEEKLDLAEVEVRFED